MKKLFALVVLAGVVSIANVALAADAALVGDAKAGEGKNAMCIGCHGIPGYKTTFPDVYQVPMLTNQSAKYIESALKAYKAGQRKHPTMRSIAAGLSEQDMLDLAAYYANAHANISAAQK